MVKLKPVTEYSWLVLTDDGLGQVALLSEQKNKYILIAKGAKTTFDNRGEVSAFFNETDLFSRIVEPAEEVESETFINGYPVDYEKPIQSELEGEFANLPLFVKKEGSQAYYAAGYYCVKFPKNWAKIFCPKLSTLEKYEFEGPFKLERETKSVLTKLRRCQK